MSARGNEPGNDSADYTTSYAHDAAGNLLSQTDPLGHEQRWTHDRAGNQASATDEAGKVTTFAYDDADRLLTTARPDASELQMAYDRDGLITSTIDGAGVRTTYAHDALGRLATTTDPNAHATRYGYDAGGNLTTIVDASSATTTNTYDASNRLTGIRYSDGTTPNVTLGYDAAGRRTSMVDGTGTSSFAYDELGRLTRSTDGAAATVRYTWDRADRLTVLRYSNGSDVTRGFDDAGRLTSVTDWLGNATTFAYDADGNLARTTFPGGTGMEDVRSYDEAGQLTDIAIKQGGVTQASLAYDRDPRGLVSQIAQTGLPGASTLDYAYTDLAELASENSDTFAYDTAGNLVELAGDGPLDYDDAGQLLEGPVPPGSSGTDAEFDYDQLGSRVEARPVGGSATRYAYDQEKRVKAFTPAGGSTTTYAYDGGSLRAARTTGATTKRYTWDRSGSLALMLSDGDNSYVHGPGGRPIAHIAGSTVRYYHQDALGSTRVLSDGRGATVGAFTYAPYGTLSASSGSETTPLGFAGEQTDAESGLQYLRARYYDPATGQFLTRDPLVEQTGQPYAYAGSDPLNYADPSGMLPSIAEIGMFVSDAAAGALNDITFGFSNRIVGVDGSCAGVGYRWGGRATLFTGTGIVRFGARNGARFVANLPVGQKGNPLNVLQRNTPADIGGRRYSGHALDRMQGRGIPPSAVEDAIANGVAAPGAGSTIKYYSPANRVTVIVNSRGGVVTVRHGRL